MAASVNKRTLRGVVIDRREKEKNANDATRVKREFDSNLIDESDLQDEKQFDPRISIFLPISIPDDINRFRIHL
jgi:hypothetical protein